MELTYSADGEVLEIIKLKPKNGVIGGKRQTKKAMYEILSCCISGKIICVSDEAAVKAAALGMIKIFKFDEE